ncbi:MAG TPA: type 1 glutamine amidotransferase [Spirillospora sp.]|nr:type 1 glutamine amidotransferase [Spirillospora sp.]
MATKALALVHDPAKSRRERIPGALATALARRGIELEVASFVGGTEKPGLNDHEMLVIMGSHESARDPGVPWLADELAFVASATERGLPIIGICFGGQLLARSLKGAVTSAVHSERGFTAVESHDPGLIRPGPWMQLHSEAFTLPPGATEIARNPSGPQAFVMGNTLGVQFHPEMTVDSFESWIERWDAEGPPSQGEGGALDVDALRRDIARHEEYSGRACDRLIGTFCARHLSSVTQR